MVTNRIAEALVERVGKAIEREERFRCVICLPCWPEGDLQVKTKANSNPGPNPNWTLNRTRAALWCSTGSSAPCGRSSGASKQRLRRAADRGST